MHEAHIVSFFAVYFPSEGRFYSGRDRILVRFTSREKAGKAAQFLGIVHPDLRIVKVHEC